MSDTYSAFVLGPTGLVGSSLIAELLANEKVSQVRTFSRRPLAYSSPKLQLQIVDLKDVLTAVDFYEGDVVFCALGTTLKKAGSREAFEKIDYELVLRMARLAAMKGIKKFSVVSSAGANPRSLNFYSQVKGKTEEELQRIPFQSLRIYRPSLLLGERSEFRVGEKLAQVLMTPLGPLLGAWRGTPARLLAQKMIHDALNEDLGKWVVSNREILSFAKTAK